MDCFFGGIARDSAASSDPAVAAPGSGSKRVSHAESQIALAKIAERRSRQAGHASVLQQSVCKLLGFPVSLRNVGKHVERAFGHAARESFNAIQSGNESIASPVELGAHPIHRTLVTAYGFNPRHLRE